MKHFVKNPFYPHLHRCPGCQIDLKETAPPIWQNIVTYFQQLGYEPLILHKGSPFGWRCRAKLAVRGTAENPLIGLFEEGSHKVVPILFCPVHHPSINRAIELIHQFVLTHRLQPYNEITGKGDLRYLQFVVDRKSGKIQVSFVLNFKHTNELGYRRWKSLIEKLGKEDKEWFWHSLWINLNAQQTNTIFGSDWQLIYGEELLWESLNGVSVCFQPASFAQANLDLFEQMLKRLYDIVPEHSKIAEFYAGVGVIGLSIASKSAWVRCSEINPHAIECFSYSKNELPIQYAQRISFHTGAASRLLNVVQDTDVVIVDPPRKGLDKELLQELLKPSSPKQLVYVSCGWPSFQKDCEYLLKGGWRLDFVEGYWFFPGSNHIEILANFIK